MLLYRIEPFRVEVLVRASALFAVVADTWQIVSANPANGVCTAEAHLLRAGESVDVRVSLPYDLPDGTYRIVLPWLGDPTLSEDRRATPPFVVATPPIIALP